MSSFGLNNLAFLGGISAVGFLPPDISNLEAWYDANDESIITKSANRISDLENKPTSNTFDLAQATGANQPLFVAADQNGKNIMRDDGARFMDTGNISAISQPMTIYFVAKTSATQDANIRELLRETTGTTVQIGVHTSANTNKMNAQFNASSFASDAVTGLLDAWHMFRLVVNGASSSWEIDEVARGTGNLGTGTLDDFKISSATNGWDRDIGEIIIYSKVVSGSEQTDLESYLTTKWGV